MTNRVRGRLSNKRKPPDGRYGLDWDRIYREREERQGPEAAARERERSPFDENGNLKSSIRKRELEEARVKERLSRAKNNPTPAKKSGAMAFHENGMTVEEKRQIVLLYSGGMKPKAIAQTIGRKENTVFKFIQRARADGKL